MNTVTVIFLIAFILFLWTCGDLIDFVVRITKQKKLFKIDQYYAFKENGNFYATYAEFLYAKYPSWKTKLISCNICLCFWISVLFSIILSFSYTSFIDIFFNLPVIYMSSMIIFLIAKKLYNNQ